MPLYTLVNVHAKPTVLYPSTAELLAEAAVKLPLPPKLPLPIFEACDCSAQDLTGTMRPGKYK
jgi:hypothetical protein